MTFQLKAFLRRVEIRVGGDHPIWNVTQVTWKRAGMKTKITFTPLRSLRSLHCDHVISIFQHGSLRLIINEPQVYTLAVKGYVRKQ